MLCASANTKREQRQNKISAIEIKQRLVAKGLTVSQVARNLGYARNTVSLSIHHPTLYPSVRSQVIKHLGL